MWGANKWTDKMFKRYWWAVLILALLYLIVKFS